ncbi:unnamed protein product [Vitrella brassicaformis CCMP3155]|uniref:Protein kinase domain-containing protein n=1 Tax=Vitrella brassicaformis (strain CCMP3155) TaxID=1169540 RepID=A0A0G4GWU2_VITBC|nr:unnamed protein product [Vitrella brassicaformis CCMP3155]|eukprot:CEM35427.1 unnamed protein product [Vitrella brassicaformis CCMP3155]
MVDEVGVVVQDTYEIVEKIGEGGCGTTYKAKHPAHDDLFALKKMMKQDNIPRSVFDIYKLLCRAQHGNIGKIVKVIEEDDCYWVVMEFIDGEPVEDYIDDEEEDSEEEEEEEDDEDDGEEDSKDGDKEEDSKDSKTISVDDFWQVVRGVLRGLRYLHEDRKVYHRDVKADNVMITFIDDQLRHVRLIDFDLCHEIGKPMTVIPSENAVPIGTLRYKAPELYAGHFDKRSDLFAVGVIAWRLITGKWPYKLTDEKEEQMDNYAIRETITEQLQQSLSNQDETVASKLAMYPGASSLLPLLLSPDPNDRAPSAIEALWHLAGIQRARSEA